LYGRAEHVYWNNKAWVRLVNFYCGCRLSHSVKKLFVAIKKDFH